jgi:protein-disulfide isomerase
MTANRPAGRPSSGKSAPPTSRRSARQQRLASRESNRAITKASTRGSGGNGGTNSILLWSAVAVVVAVVVVGALLIASQGKKNLPDTPTTPGVVTPTTIPVSGTTLGNANAPVTVDLYGDFRCSACLAFTVEGTEKQLVDRHPRGHGLARRRERRLVRSRSGQVLDDARLAVCQSGPERKRGQLH